MTNQIIKEDKIDIHTVVRERYGAIAEKSIAEEQSGCCPPTQSTSSCCGSSETPEKLGAGECSPKEMSGRFLPR